MVSFSREKNFSYSHQPNKQMKKKKANKNWHKFWLYSAVKCIPRQTFYRIDLAIIIHVFSFIFGRLYCSKSIPFEFPGYLAFNKPTHVPAALGIFSCRFIMFTTGKQIQTRDMKSISYQCGSIFRLSSFNDKKNKIIMIPSSTKYKAMGLT